MTATEKWDDPFFFDLTPENKLIFLYLLDKCNHAGIIDFNEKIASFLTGLKVSRSEILEAFKGRVIVLKSGKLFIPKFIEFQYGELVENNNTHKSVISLLKKEGVFEGLGSPLQGDKDKDKDKDKDIDKENEVQNFEKTLSDCILIAQKDEKWIRLNSTNQKELEGFKEKLEKEGIYFKTPIDFKTHFSRWKAKQPQQPTKHLKL